MPKPSGPQFISVFHSSNDPMPPHLRVPEPGQHSYTPDDNIHPDIIHMGTRAAAQDWTHRQHLHEYKINVNHPSVSPVTFGESPAILDVDHAIDREAGTGSDAHNDLYSHFQERMSGKQPGLFEETPPDTKGAAEKGIVTPYRNRREDSGSISWIVPKSQIGDDTAVQYVRGFKPRKIKK